jgi:hypothetical protein
MRGCSAKAFLETMLGVVVPLYCLCLFAFLRIGYDQRFYPIVVSLHSDKWSRVVIWLVISMLIEILLLVCFIWYHRTQENIAFAPFFHGQKVVRTMATTLGPMCATGYLMTTLVVCTHKFLPG